MAEYCLSDADLDIAEIIAQALTAHKTDPNEVAGCVTFLHGSKAAQFFLYLDTVIAEGRIVARSKQTIPYYQTIHEVCRKHLWAYRENPAQMAQILGWAVRLMRYYQVPGVKRPPLPRPAQKPEGAPAPRPASPPPRPNVASSETRLTGKIKNFNAAKGYGFITPDAGGDDVFVHKSNIAGQRMLTNGQRVSYTLGPGRQGLQALDVKPE